MKQRLLVVSAALLLMGSAAMAKVVDGVRQFPSLPLPNFSELVQDGTTVQYLYNVDAQSFFRGANDWMTRATMDDTLGYKFKINVEGTNVAGDTTYVSLSDYVLKFSAYYKVFADGTTGIWVDNNNGANANTWVITPVEGSSLFTIGNAAYPGTVLGGFRGDVGTVGVNDCTSAGIYLNLVKPDSVGLCATWAAVSETDYKAYIDANTETIRTLVGQYNKSGELKAKIDECKQAEGFTVPAKYTTIYEDESKTVAELEQAIADLAADYTDFVNNKASQATLDNPVEITSQIANVDGSSITNWTRTFTGEGSTGSLKCNTWSVEGASDGTNMLTPFIENWASAGNSLSDQIVQHDTVKVAPGAYLITARVRCYNESSGAESSKGYSLFANNNSVDLHEEGGDYFTYNSMLGYWKSEPFEVYAVVSADSCLTFGMKLEGADFNWLAHKDYHIYALGQTDEALKKAASANPSVKKYKKDDYITASLRDEWNVCADKYLNGETAAEIMQAQLDLNALKDTVSKNAAAWASLLVEIEAAEKVAGNTSISGDDVADLSDYLLDVEEILAEKELTTEEIKAEEAKISEMRQAAIQNGLAAGTDFSDYLTNTDFSQGTTGWTFNKISGSTCVANASAKCAEGWNANFDIYQIVRNAPVGVYKITVQGFFRKGRDNDAWYLYYDEYGEKLEEDQLPASMAYVYMNDNKTPLNSVFDNQVPYGEVYSSGTYTDPNGTYWYPNDMTSAGAAFDAGYYQMSAFGLVAQKGDSLRIGMKGDLSGGDNWAIFTRCKLTYEGFDASIIQPELEKAIKAMDLTVTMGSEVLTNAQEVKASAENVDKTDGKAMFEALAAIYAVNTKVSESETLFANLKDKNEAFLTTISESQAAEATKTDAATLYNEIADAIEGGSYTNADAEAAITKIAEMTVKLAIPDAASSASDENPVDMTSLLQSPGFEKEGSNSVEGWTCTTTGYSFGNSTTQKAALCIEFYEKTYDFYQDITGLPNGMYLVKMKGFYRYGTTSQDYAHYAAGEDGLAYIYAIATNDTVKGHVKHLCSYETSFEEQQGVGTETTFTTGSDVVRYVPNDVVSARNYFDLGLFENGVYVKVTDNKLRIGISQETSVTGGWMIMDDWTLTYYGENSTKEEGLGLAAIEDNAPVASVEMFNINGQPVNALQPGVTLVRTTSSNGTVTVRKVTVK